MPAAGDLVADAAAAAARAGMSRGWSSRRCRGWPGSRSLYPCARPASSVTRNTMNSSSRRGVGGPAALGQAVELTCAGSGAARRRRASRRATRGRPGRGRSRVPARRSQRRDVRPDFEVAVAGRPRGHRVALDGVHLDVDGQQVVAGLGAVRDHVLDEVPADEPLALDPALHVGEPRRTVSTVPLSTASRSSSSSIATSRQFLLGGLDGRELLLGRRADQMVAGVQAEVRRRGD